MTENITIDSKIANSIFLSSLMNFVPAEIEGFLFVEAYDDVDAEGKNASKMILRRVEDGALFSASKPSSKQLQEWDDDAFMGDVLFTRVTRTEKPFITTVVTYEEFTPADREALTSPVFTWQERQDATDALLGHFDLTWVTIDSVLSLCDRMAKDADRILDTRDYEILKIIAGDYPYNVSTTDFNRVYRYRASIIKMRAVQEG